MLMIERQYQWDYWIVFGDGLGVREEEDKTFMELPPGV
jgi:hypothetical protein